MLLMMIEAGQWALPLVLLSNTSQIYFNKKRKPGVNVGLSFFIFHKQVIYLKVKLFIAFIKDSLWAS